MSTTTISLEQELQAASRRIEELRADAADKKAAADKIVADYRDKGVNPLEDAEAFRVIDEAYKLSDGPAQEATDLDERRQTLADRLSGKSSTRSTRAAAAMLLDPVGVLRASPDYQKLAQAGAFESAGARIEIPGVEVLDRARVVEALESGRPFKFRAATFDGVDVIPSDRRFFPLVDLVPVRQPRVLDLVTVTTTDTNKIDYVQLTTRTDAAAPQALGTAYDEATYDTTPAEASVKDIGHWVPAHRSQLADEGQIRGLLENLLEIGVRLELEDQVISGNGAGQNMSGILQETTQEVTRDTTNERRLEAVHRAITTVRLARFGEPDGVVMHPTDYEQMLFEGELDDTGMAKGNYLLPAAVTGATPRTVWGLPIAATTAITENTGLVGQFKLGATVFLRTGVSTRISDSHSDFFIKRMVAILSEVRAALAVYLPDAFCEVDLI